MINTTAIDNYMINSVPENIKELLHQALGRLEPFEQCALLNYPDYPNIGDHLIGLGTLFYLTDVRKTNIKYIASIGNFSGSVMEKKIGKAPILLQGGGNLGDLWYEHQKFREQIISEYRNQPVIILPQSIYFAEEANLRNAANIFNSHPNLTLFTRDDYSYELAIQYFSNCQVIKAPDMALQLVKMPGLSFDEGKEKSILYHCRKDKELNQTSSPVFIDLPNIVIQDWYTTEDGNKYYQETSSTQVNQLITQICKSWQQGTVIPPECIAQQRWKYFHPYAYKLNTIYQPLFKSSLIHKSWMYMHQGISQFKQYSLIITNRLHGHILCILMGIPHIFLPNAYYKNEAFYEAWTSSIQFCRFVKEPSQIEIAAQNLFDLFPHKVAVV